MRRRRVVKCGIVLVRIAGPGGILRGSMILAGIDEAGYGPLLGPLVVGCCAFEVDGAGGDSRGPLPCLWKRLRKHVSKNRLRSGRKIHVNDSKAVYNPTLGVRELERAVLALTSTWDAGAGADFDAFLGSVAPHVLDDVGQYDWYAPPTCGETFPMSCDGTAVKLFANALRLELTRTLTRPVHLGARVVLERQFNRMLADTRNKGSTLFSISAMHIDLLLNRFADQGLVIFCDRQGGREHYGALLRQMFDEWSLEIVSEIEGRAEYWLTRGNGGPRVRLIFCEKAEGLCMSVAVASMLSKYLRELLMHRFNAYWRQHLPDLAPTAGYYTDGERFLRDIASKRSELGIADEQLVRCR